MCVGSVAGGQGACYGDGGSGVYTFDTNINKYILLVKNLKCLNRIK